MNIEFGPDVLHDFEDSSRREWLETNGIGGFASGTVAGVNTRRYHSLLCAATVPPLGRMIMVSQLHERLTVGEASFELSSAQYPGNVHPKGYELTTHFRLDPSPTWTIRAGGVVIEKSILTIHGENTTVVSYLVREAPGRIKLAIRPALACRDYHQLRRETGDARIEPAVQPGLLTFQPFADVPPVHVGHPPGTWRAESFWYRNNEYLRELDRGLEFKEDLLSPGVLELDMERDYRASLVLSTKPQRADVAGDLEERERTRRAQLNEGVHDHLSYWLRRAADGFIVRRGHGGRTVIAGYPWFTDWGRDTFIAIRGLCLANGRLEDARGILVEWAGTASEGMLPNRFPDSGDTPEFNSVDASLWYVIAASELLEAGRRGPALLTSAQNRVVETAIRRIVEGYASGTRFGIRMDADGLLAAGVAGVQLTWMDARVGDRVITPRIGKPVEIQALWLNALRVAARFDSAWRRVLESGRRSFNERFWNDRDGCLADVVDVDHVPGTRDETCRPNQILAVGGLPMMVIERDRARRVVDAVERRLLTPLGLRSLAPEEPGYVPRYEGGPEARDAVYHQGTVWPWLMGPFVEAWVRVRGNTAAVRNAARRRFVEPLLEHLNEAGLGHVSEIADGDAPFAPKGCPFQAWSVGELLRIDRVVLAERTRPRAAREVRQWA